jgi:hypothetical protein
MWQRSIVARGFAVIQEVFGASEISVLRDELSNAPLRRSRAGARHILGNADVAKLAKDPRLLEVARVVLGGEARPFRATLFDKSPTANWLVVWLCGIRTQHCRCGTGLKSRAGDPGL